MSSKGSIQNIVIIAVILVAVFLSQQLYFKVVGESIYAEASKRGVEYWSKAKGWFGVSIYPRVSGEVGGIQSTVAKGITEQKNNLAQNIWEKIKNYFAEKFSNISGTKVE